MELVAVIQELQEELRLSNDNSRRAELQQQALQEALSRQKEECARLSAALSGRGLGGSRPPAVVPAGAGSGTGSAMRLSSSSALEASSAAAVSAGGQAGGEAASPAALSEDASAVAASNARIIAQLNEQVRGRGWEGRGGERGEREQGERKAGMWGCRRSGPPCHDGGYSLSLPLCLSVLDWTLFMACPSQSFPSSAPSPTLPFLHPFLFCRLTS